MRTLGIFKTIGLLSSYLLLGACSSAPALTPAPDTETVSKTPHPSSDDLESLHQLFQSPAAPKGALGEFADVCDEEFTSKNAVALVKQDGERMHWCFYAKLARLQENLKGDKSWNARQKQVRDAFQFLSPIANAFLQINQDNRYSLWEKRYYSKVSEWVFFKKSNRSPASVSTSNRAPASVITPIKKPQSH